MLIRDALFEAKDRIGLRDAQVLLRFVLHCDQAWLLAHPEAELSPASAEQFHRLLRRRERFEPIQYLTGTQEFYGLELEVTRDVLIPRPETELLVEAVLQHVSEQPSPVLEIVDVGTGSGAIALVLASRCPECRVDALDLSWAALRVARQNADRLLPEGRLSLRQSDLLAAYAGQRSVVDIVVSNPPYIPAGDAPALQPEVRDFEPHEALFAGADGLEIYRRLIPQAADVLRPGGLLALEFGFGQQPALEELLRGWSAVRFQADYAGISRIALATRPFETDLR